uniref:G_PROTEIN_RECEP_F1_2 domain-containing protein n=1 Tax=Heterorhabditis bacteriophora TaxID=37862 RepID=A0A1I7XE37_HETBA
MNVSNSEENSFEPDQCDYQPQVFLEWKMIFVGYIGLITALISIIHNCLLFYAFTTSKILRRRNLTYLMWISGCDIFISICYIAIMCVQVYSDYYASFYLFYLWHCYLRFAFTVSHITLSSSSFLLMAATIERYLQSTGDNRAIQLFRILDTNRTLVVLFCFIASCIFRGTVFFEVTVKYNHQCSGFSSMGLVASNLFSNPVMDAVWKFWIRKIVTVFLPFGVLAYFNAAIVMNVRRTDRDQTVKALVLFITVGSRGEVTRLRSRLRTVTRMLVMVVCCYLAANILDVVIAFWETIDISALNANQGIYAVTTDISSFLPILACALRLPIYIINDKQIRIEVHCKVQQVLQRLCIFCPRLARFLRVRTKWYDSKLEAERFFAASPRTSFPRTDLEVKYGMGSLIMARASLSTQKELQELRKFREAVLL